MSRRLPIKSLQTEEPVLSLSELIDALQEAGVELGTQKVRGNDYSRAVAAQKMVQVRAKLDAALAGAPLAMPALEQMDLEHADA